MIERTYANEWDLMQDMDRARRVAEEHQAVLAQLEGLEIGGMTSTTARRLRIVAGELHIDPPGEGVPDDSIWSVRRTDHGFDIEEWRRP